MTQISNWLAMLLLVIVAFISTRTFYRAALDNSYHRGKAASAPILGLMLILAANHVILALFLACINLVEVAESIVNSIVWLNGLFVILAYLAFLRRNFESITTGR